MTATEDRVSNKNLLAKSPEPHVLISELTLRNVLSFGPDAEPVPLGALNVLIGANGSGKSNFIDALSLLRATPADVRAVIRRGGGVNEWIWKGNPEAVASLDVVLSNAGRMQPLRHVLNFRAVNQGFLLEDERIESEHPKSGEAKPYFFYHFQNGAPVLNVAGAPRRLRRETVEVDQSILAQRKDAENYPELFFLSTAYERIRIFREWSFGRNTIFREPQKADMRNDRLEEDFSNLGLFLNRMRRSSRAKTAILNSMHNLYEGIDDFDVSIEGGSVQVFLSEGPLAIPATRLSDGTLRYLCLMAILCDPDPAPFIVIEEPELGLHPDILPGLVNLMIEASTRTQLVVTTHSDIIIDALTERPDSVQVVSKEDRQTQLQRLSADDLQDWLKHYRLGQVWMKGAIGGTRW